MSVQENSSPYSELPPNGPGSRSRRRWFLGTSGLLLICILWAFRDVLVPFLLALILAYVFSPVVKAGERLQLGGRSAPRWAVVLTLYAALVMAITVGSLIAVPRLSAEFTRLASDAPRLVARARREMLPVLERRLSAATASYRAELEGPTPDGESPKPSGDVVAAPNRAFSKTAIQVVPTSGGGYEVRLPAGGIQISQDGDNGRYVIAPRSHAHRSSRSIAATLSAAISKAIQNTEKGTISLVQTAQKLVAALARGVFGFVMMLMLSAYMLVSSDTIFVFFRSLYPPGKRTQFDVLVGRLDRGLAGVVRGQLTISAVNGVLSGIGFYMLGLKYWVFLTLLATALSVIPIFGSILSTIPAVLVALPDSTGTAALVLLWVVGIHQIEANLLNPKIMGDAARVHPVLVVFALLAGEHVAGIVGALFAVPFLSITQTLFLYLRERHLGVPRTPSVPPPSPI